MQKRSSFLNKQVRVNMTFCCCRWGRAEPAGGPGCEFHGSGPTRSWVSVRDSGHRFSWKQGRVACFCQSHHTWALCFSFSYIIWWNMGALGCDLVCSPFAQLVMSPHPPHYQPHLYEWPRLTWILCGWAGLSLRAPQDMFFAGKRRQVKNRKSWFTLYSQTLSISVSSF